MANNGTLRKSIRNDLNLRLVYSAVSNPTDNSSTVTAVLYVDRRYSMYATVTGSITLDGTTKQNDFRIDTSNGGSFEVVRISKTLKHNASGDKSFNLSGFVDFRGTNLSGQVLYRQDIANTSVTLDRIDRLITASLPNFTLNQSVRVTLNRPNKPYTVSCGVYANGSHIFNIGTVTGNFYDLKLNQVQLEKIYNLSPNSDTVNMEFRCWTEDRGGKHVGTFIAKAKGKIPLTVIPTAGEINTSEANPKNRTGNFIRDMSKVRMSLSYFNGVYGSSIVSVNWQVTDSGARSLFKASSKDAVIWENVKNHGNTTIRATVTDSRGRSVTKTKSIYISAYRKPAIDKPKVFRSKINGTADPSSNRVTVTADLYSADVSGSNPVTVTIYYKPTNASAWTMAESFRENKLHWDQASKLNKVVNNLFADISTSYQIKITIGDMFSTAEWVGAIGFGKPVVAFSKHGVAFGGFPSGGGYPLEVVGGNLGLSGYIEHIGGNNSVETFNLPLLNGWTGFVKCRRDIGGNLWIWGNITPGKQARWTGICKLPSGIAEDFKGQMATIMAGSDYGACPLEARMSLVLNSATLTFMAFGTLASGQNLKFSQLVHTLSGW